ncbi:hypothetical protein FOA52_014536 [Chlamydomonas sp. UWO 241]|nr:hypothetical protein FOA52_014536 [Chlamydomonas sp. UWO 241]
MAAVRDDTPAAQLPTPAHANLTPTHPALPGPKGKRKGAKGRSKAPKDGDELVGVRVFMPGSEFYGTGLRPRHVVGSILGHDDANRGCMVVRITGERKRYFFPMGLLRAWAAAAAAAGSSDDEPGFEYANEDGVVVEQPPLPMREGSRGSLGELASPSGEGQEAREGDECPSEGFAERDALMEGATQAAAGGEEEGSGARAAAAAGSPQPSSARRSAAAAAVAAAGAKRPAPCPEGGEEQAGARITPSRRKRARTVPEAAAAAAAVAASVAPHASAPTTAPSAPRATPPPQQSGAPGSVDCGVDGGSDGGGADAGTTGVRKVAAGGRPKKRRGRAGTLREQLSDIVGKGVDIPGGIFGQDIPGFFYPARVVGPDKAHPGCVIVSLQDGSRARYFFPVPDVREWVAGMHTRLGLDWQEEHDTVDGESVAFAARVLVDMAASGGGGLGIGWVCGIGGGGGGNADGEMQTTAEGGGEEGGDEEAAEAGGGTGSIGGGVSGAVEGADAAGDAALLMIAAVASAAVAAEDSSGDGAVPAAAEPVAAEPAAAQPAAQPAARPAAAEPAEDGGGDDAVLAAAEPATVAEGGVGVSMAGGAANRHIGERSASVSHVNCSEERGRGGARAAGGKHVPCGGRADSGCSDGGEGGVGSDGGSDADVGASGGRNSSHVVGHARQGHHVVGTPSHVSASPAASGDGGGGGRGGGRAESSDADSPTGVVLMRPAHASTPCAPLSGAAAAAGVAVTDRRGPPSPVSGQKQQQAQQPRGGGWRGACAPLHGPSPLGQRAAAEFGHWQQGLGQGAPHVSPAGSGSPASGGHAVQHLSRCLSHPRHAAAAVRQH